MKLKGNSAVVTGGGNGIGRALCLALAGKGMNVAVVDIEPEAAEAVAEEVAALGVASLARRVDVIREDELEALADAAWAAFGSVEVLVNNAGVMHASNPLWKTSAEDLSWCFSVNVAGPVNGIRAFAPRFIESGRPAWIVNTGSEHSLGVPHLSGGLYTATKHAVLGLSDVLRRELPSHVGVSVLCPGLVETSLWRAGERRQQEYGGGAEANPAAAMALQLGMRAEEVAEKAVAGIENEAFLIVTHAHAVEYAEERWNTIRAAFAEQAPRYEGDDRYTVDAVIRKLTSQNR